MSVKVASTYNCDMDKFNGIQIFLFILINFSKYDGVFLISLSAGGSLDGEA